jgi:hypothetical protein
MALNFPTSPSLNQTHTVGSKTWKWNGYAWDIQVPTGGAGATESLNVVFDNSNATQYKVVALNANGETVLATSLSIEQIDRVLGILDDVGETVTFGAITNPSWTWTPEQSLYLGSNGTIATTSTIDGAAFSLKIGYAISPTKAFIKIGTPVVL